MTSTWLTVDRDVYEPEAFAGSTHVVSPRGALACEAIRAAAGGLVDAYRRLHPDDVQHTWWDYRQGHFHRGLGLRIDLARVPESLLHQCEIERNYRKGKKPPDDAPLAVDLAERSPCGDGFGLDSGRAMSPLITPRRRP